MSNILALETTTKNCSISIFKDGKLVILKENISEKYSHSEELTVFIESAMNESKLKPADLDAVAISKGPGSYTGLRIGTASAKGLCYALDIPLISVSTLEAMSYSVSIKHESDYYCPMIDARRMEVYSAIFDKDNNCVRGIKADIINKNTYQEYRNKRLVYFGDGAFKCKEFLNYKNAEYLDGVFPSSKNMGHFAKIKFDNKDFEDLISFEPYYLKDFIPG